MKYSKHLHKLNELTVSKSRALLIGIGVLLVISITAVAFWQQSLPAQRVGKPTPTAIIGGTRTESKGGFTLIATYQGNSLWNYSVTAQLPTPCDTAQVDALVAESYPEQVTVRVVTSRVGEMCVEVIQDFAYDGSFSASEKATISLSIND